MAYCPECGNEHKIHELAARQAVIDDVIANPPAGTWFFNSLEGTKVGGTTRSTLAIALVPFTILCCWACYLGLVQSIERNGLNADSLLMLVLGGGVTVILFWQALKSSVGKVEVIIRGDDCQLFEGVWVIGRRRNVSWEGVVSIDELAESDSESMWYVISLLENKRLKFGHQLSDQRRYYMINVLRDLKVKYSKPDAVAET